MLTESITFSAAFIAGILSFFTPCILPLIPAYFTFITGYSLEELTDNCNSEIRKNVIFSTLLYVTGFSIVFILMGASASFVGNLVFEYRDFIRVAGGIVVLIFGIHFLGIFRIKGLEYEKRIHIKKKPLHFLGTILIGMAFAAGWTPCIGPILGSILIVASGQEMLNGILLLSFFSAGIALPFLLISIFITFLLVFIKKANKVIMYVNFASGILMIIIGILLIFDKIAFLSIN